MPIFEYRCLQCERSYEVFHKGRELAEDVVCPACGSARARKLMSVAAVATRGSAPSPSERCAAESGGCCGGSCGLE